MDELFTVCTMCFVILILWSPYLFPLVPSSSSFSFIIAGLLNAMIYIIFEYTNPLKCFPWLSVIKFKHPIHKFGFWIHVIWMIQINLKLLILYKDLGLGIQVSRYLFGYFGRGKNPFGYFYISDWVQVLLVRVQVFWYNQKPKLCDEL